MASVAEPRAAARGRNLTWWQFLLLVVVYAAIIQVGGRVIGADVDSDAGWETAGNMLESAVIPIALSSVFAVGLATWLGWWDEIIHEPLRVQRWVRIVPIALLLTAAVGASGGNLLDQQADLVPTLVVLVASSASPKSRCSAASAWSRSGVWV
jgi:hypothetical protein